MRALRALLLCAVLLNGCLYHAREATDATMRDLVAQPFDLARTTSLDPAKPGKTTDKTTEPAKEAKNSPQPPMDVQTTALMEGQPIGPKGLEIFQERTKMPAEIPGAEAPRFEFAKMNKQERAEAIRKWYGELQPLPKAPTALPGPGGKPYTLADLQQKAAENSAQLRQAASDVFAARGNLILARAYPNPKFSYVASPSNDGSTAGVQGFFVDQVVNFGGKIKLTAAAAEMDLRNAELALRRARSDLSTAVRNAYFAVLVAKETVEINTAMARLTDNMYRVQVDYEGLAAAYEPGALRAQAYIARLALKGSIDTYIYSWKQLAAVIGLRQLPLTELAGRIDTAIPLYDFDAVKDYALRNHTDVLTARNAIDKARYNVKLAQITPYSDVEFNIGVQKETALPPMQWVPSATVSVTLPIWDQNRGAIMAAEAALVRASEEPHRVETTIVGNLAAAYQSYKINIDSLEYYRRYILPDQVRTYIGTRDRYYTGGLGGVTFADVVSAQQTLATNITTYLGLLGTLWSSAIGVADFLQTDDLFQLAKPLGMERVPQLEALPPWPCGHGSVSLPGMGGAAECCITQKFSSSADHAVNRLIKRVGWRLECSEAPADMPGLPKIATRSEQHNSPDRNQENNAQGLVDSAQPKPQPSNCSPDQFLPPAVLPAFPSGSDGK
jgi:cobalt-zinc-cadmium efflux system outer membrane protein